MMRQEDLSDQEENACFWGREKKHEAQIEIFTFQPGVNEQFQLLVEGQSLFSRYKRSCFSSPSVPDGCGRTLSVLVMVEVVHEVSSTDY